MDFIRSFNNTGLFIGLLMCLHLIPLTLSAQEVFSWDEPVLEFVWSNDFVNQTDRYFSNGFELTLYHPFMKKSPTRFLLLPDAWANKVVHGLTLTHHFFTPDQLFVSDIVANDRPYASYLLAGHRKIAFNQERKMKLLTALQVGLLGKFSGGESVQNGIHELLPASKPATGWENQINPDFALNYSLRFEKGIVSNHHFDLIPHGGARVGIPYTDVDAGIYFRFGKYSDYFNCREVLLIPALM